MTRTQLKAEGFKPAPEQKPVARISGRHDVYDLYDKVGAVPVSVLSEAQKAAAEKAIKEAQSHFRDPIVTQIVPLSKFYPAESYHQDYFRLNPDKGYCKVVIAPKLEKLKKSK